MAYYILYYVLYSDWLRTWRQVHLEKSRKVPFTKVRGHHYDPYIVYNIVYTPSSVCIIVVGMLHILWLYLLLLIYILHALFYCIHYSYAHIYRYTLYACITRVLYIVQYSYTIHIHTHISHTHVYRRIPGRSPFYCPALPESVRPPSPPWSLGRWATRCECRIYSVF